MERTLPSVANVDRDSFGLSHVTMERWVDT